MNPLFKYVVTAAASAALSAGCTSPKVATDTQQAPQQGELNIAVAAKPPLASRPPAIPAPEAILYKTAGDYRDNLPVRLNPDGSLQSFPAPADIPADPRPVELKGGWLLSPIGVSANTVFTTYTYEEYRKLPAPPAPSELLKSVIPGSGVTATVRIPMTTAQALADPAAAEASIPVVRN